MKKRKRKGISLIVLVITIIVIIILAAAIIITLNKNNPIEEANRARIESDVANMQAIFTNTVAKIMAKNQGTIEVEEGEINSVKSGVSSTEGQVNYKFNNPMDSSNTDGKVIFDNKENNETTYYTGKKLPIYGAGETTWYVDKEGIISLRVGEKEYGKGEQVEKPAEPVEEEKAKEGEIVKDVAKKYEDADGDIAIIPIDFAIVPGKTDISNGLVISDEGNDVNDTGNQFVWIPVDDISKFVRKNGYFTGGLQTDPNGSLNFSLCKEPYNNAIDNEKEEYDNVMKSVEKYKGFYVGRYEISNNGSNKAQSKKNKQPWTNIKWGNNMTDLGGGLVEKARNMYPISSAIEGKVVSTLMYGTAFDEIIRFLKTNTEYKNIDRNSTGFGNTGINCDETGYNATNIPIATGSNEKYSLNNIYDIVGNVWEWTMESYDNRVRTCRGGSCCYEAYKFPISFRADFESTTFSGNDVGGRVQLYIK